jgi:threonine dehydratase
MAVPEVSLPEVTLDDIRAAAERIRPIAHRTPVLTSQTFDRRTGLQAFFKCENFQRGGAFKIRGAANFVYSIPQAHLHRGVVAYSSGNHAQAVAIAAASAGIPATIVMPTDAPRSKVAGTRGYGATVVTYDRQTEDREEIGRRIAAESGATLVPPYDHPWIMAGQGTLALELLEEVPDLDALVVCVGGGGLMSGCSIAAKGLRPGIRVFGAEPELANDTYLSMQKGERVGIPPSATIADGLRSPSPGEITFPVVQRNVERILLVSEAEILQAMAFCLTRMKMLVEPSGAVSAAAALAGKLPEGIRRVGLVVSGGNLDLEILRNLPEA